jgi:hypothetical protein
MVATVPTWIVIPPGGSPFSTVVLFLFFTLVLFFLRYYRTQLMLSEDRRLAIKSWDIISDPAVAKNDRTSK